ncbi:MAG: DUF1905 domain-containing protein [Candidatus Koribacter versatilis]|uniref:DUF1905 domain-containing protein n=1 Tax=Candidatus Korobacter versatilis TaxID=658062 RepID=A0A932AB27_9BACT|nr:DUF1905 domain-containing protein [Candidatus Koribacter versatilis]
MTTPAAAAGTKKVTTFKGKLKTWLAMPGKGAWCFVRVPDSAARFGIRAQFPIVGTINGHKFRSCLQPDGKGNHCLMVNKVMQQGGGFKPGDTVLLDVKVDKSPRVVALPPVVRKALRTDKKAKAFFDRLAPSHKKQYVEWVAGAKQAETRARRAAKMVAMLAAGKKMD